MDKFSQTTHCSILKLKLWGALLLIIVPIISHSQSPISPPAEAAPPSIEAQPAPSAGRLQAGQQPGELPRPLLPPGNDNCASATTLTAGAACLSGTTDQATQQGSEYLCINPGGGINPETVWYRFTATNDSMVLGVVLTNTSNCATVLAVYGPFAAGAGCLPGAGNQLLCQNMGLIDPGFHPLLTGLSVGQQYLVQVQGNNCGGGNDRFADFCISLDPPAANNRAGTSAVINNCGVAFTGSTNGGQWANGSSIGANNLDNNNATSVGGASEIGDDVLFVINNVSWFTFCNGNASACNWSITLNGVGGCLLPAPNDGVQAALFTGTPAALVNVAASPSRIATGGSWSTGTFSVGASACAFVMVDGFAGDECNYNLTLTNVSCPCVILPVSLAYLSGSSLPDQVALDWHMDAEAGVRHYRVARSRDGQHFQHVAELPAQPAQAEGNNYHFADRQAPHGWNYYRVSAIDQNGQAEVLSTAAVQHGGSARQPQLHLDGSTLSWLLHDLEPLPTRLSLLDLQGRLLYSGQHQADGPGQAIQLALPPLSPGVYLLRSENAAGNWSQKFVNP